MSRDDPFGLSGDREKTRIRLVNVAPRQPAPGQPRREQPSYSLEPQAASVKSSRAHPNSLVAAFASLLEFAPELESAVAPENPEALRTRLLAFPLGFLALVAPLPEGALPVLSLPLQRLAAGAGEWILWGLGVPVTRDGLYLALPSVTLHITEACNGLRFLLAMLVVGVAFAGMTQKTWRGRAVVVTAALVVAVVANWLRIAGTGMLAELYGQDAATGLPHVVWGKVVYVAMLVPLVMLVLRLRRSGS